MGFEGTADFVAELDAKMVLLGKLVESEASQVPGASEASELLEVFEAVEVSEALEASAKT